MAIVYQWSPPPNTKAAAVIQLAIARGRSAPARRIGWVSD